MEQTSLITSKCETQRGKKIAQSKCRILHALHKLHKKRARKSCVVQTDCKVTFQTTSSISVATSYYTGKSKGFPFLDILGYLKNTHKNPKIGKVRQVQTMEFPTKFPDWDLSHSSKFGIFVGIL